MLPIAVKQKHFFLHFFLLNFHSYIPYARRMSHLFHVHILFKRMSSFASWSRSFGWKTKPWKTDALEYQNEQLHVVGDMSI